MDGGENVTFCQVCKLNCRTAEKYAVHITTELHKKIAQTRQNSAPKARTEEIVPHVVEQVRTRGDGASGNARFGGQTSRPAPPPPPLYNSFISSGVAGHSGRGREDFGAGYGQGYSGRGREDFGMGQSGRGRGNYSTGNAGYIKVNYGAGTPARGGYGSGPRGGDTFTKPVPLQKKSTDNNNARCEVCQLTMSGPESYQQHILGFKHEKMMVEKGIPVEEKKVRQIRYKPGVVKIQSGLDAIQSELVGLQYLVEWRHPHDKSKDPTYECFLCHSRMDVRNVLAHITGFKHKHTYLKIHYADRIRWLDPTGTIATGPKIPEWKPFLLKQVEIVAAAEGRSPVAVYEWDGVNEKPDIFTGAPAIKRPASLNQNLPEAKRQALEGLEPNKTTSTDDLPDAMSHEEFLATTKALASESAAAAKAGEASLIKLLGALKDYDIRSPGEAKLIVKIKDALLKSLEKYYIRSGTYPGAEDPPNVATSSTSQTTPVQPPAQPPVQPTPPPPPPPPPASNSWSSWQQQNGNNAAMQGMYGYGYRPDMTDYYGQQQPMWH